MEKEKGYEIVTSKILDASVYCVSDQGMCMLVVSDGADEGCVWLKTVELHYLITSLLRIRRELENDQGNS